MRNGLLLSGTLVAILVAGTAFAQTPESDAVAPAEASEAAPEAAAPARPAPVVDAPNTASYDLQLQELEDRLNELKESVFASKARLRMLWHQLMQERIGGSRIIVDHVNQLGGIFQIVRVTYALDGSQIYSANAADVENLASRNRIQIHDAPVLAGPHTIVVQVELRGNDHGMFSYMSGYEFTLSSSESFTIEDGKTADVDVIIFDHGGSSRALEERPDVRYDVDLYDTVGDGVTDASADDEGGDS